MFGSRSTHVPSDRSIGRPKLEIPVSTFAYLFSEIAQRAQSRVSNVSDLERRLADVGAGVGARALELVSARERGGRRSVRLLEALRFVHGPLWRYMFGRAAADLEQSNRAEDEYMISDDDLFVSRFASVPKEMGHLSLDAFVAGVVAGALGAEGFPARVTAHRVGNGQGSSRRTTILIKVAPSVLEREQRLQGGTGS